MKKAISRLFQIGVCTFGYLCAAGDISLAQVTSDNTVNTHVNQNGSVAEITGGETRERNLFHSFQEFSVPTENQAYFNNATDISNIFSRVTGGNVSNIDGLIRANGDASLFLINPAGIIFGEGAKLDLGGSFYGSSASSILFEDGEFSAVDNLDQPILTINAPIGLSFRDNPGDITVRGNGNGIRSLDSEIIDTQEALRVNSNATFGLVGGNLNFEDAVIKTAGGRIELGSVSTGTVDLVTVDNGFTFGYANIEAFRDISLSGKSVADVSGVGGGDINVAAKDISIAGVSAFTADTLGSETGGDINIFAQESLAISGVANEQNFVSAISNRTFPNGSADAGDINIETGSLSIGDRAFIATTTSRQGDAGNIDINARDSVTLESQGNTSAIASNVATDAVGNGGDINITTSSLDLSNGAFINVSTLGQGDAGNIAIDTNSLSLTNGASLNANTRAEGNAGNININAANISIDGQGNSDVDTGVFSNVGSSAVGDGGNINITTESLTVNSGTTLDAGGDTQGNGGNVTINATGDVSFANGSGISVTGAEGGSITNHRSSLSS